MRILAVFLLILFSAGPLTAATPEEAERLVADSIDQVRDILLASKEEPTSPEDDPISRSKQSQILELLRDVCDFQLMAKLTLGRQVWPAMSEEQKKVFTDLFIEQLRRSYVAKISLLIDRQVTVLPAEVSGNKVTVATKLTRSDEKNVLVYKLYQRGGRWKGYDIEIDGISVIRSFRSQYQESLEAGGVGQLIQDMRESLGVNHQ